MDLWNSGLPEVLAKLGGSGILGLLDAEGLNFLSGASSGTASGAASETATGIGREAIGTIEASGPIGVIDRQRH